MLVWDYNIFKIYALSDHSEITVYRDILLQINHYCYDGDDDAWIVILRVTNILGSSQLLTRLLLTLFVTPHAVS